MGEGRHKEFRVPVRVAWDGGPRRPRRDDRGARGARLSVDAQDELRVPEPVAKAEDGRLVTISLDRPVATRLEVRPRMPAG